MEVEGMGVDPAQSESVDVAPTTKLASYVVEVA